MLQPVIFKVDQVNEGFARIENNWMRDIIVNQAFMAGTKCRKMLQNCSVQDG